MFLHVLVPNNKAKVQIFLAFAHPLLKILLKLQVTLSSCRIRIFKGGASMISSSENKQIAKEILIELIRKELLSDGGSVDSICETYQKITKAVSEA